MGRGLAPHAAWPPQRRCYHGSRLVAATKRETDASQSSSAGAGGAAAEGAAATPRRRQTAVESTGEAAAPAAGGAGVVALLKARLGVELRANHRDIPFLDRHMDEGEEVLEGMIQAWGRDLTAAWVRRLPNVLRVGVWRQEAVLSRLMERLGLTRADALRAIRRDPRVLQFQPDNVDARLAAAINALGGCGRATIKRHPVLIGYVPITLKANMDTLAATLGLASDDKAMGRFLRRAPQLLTLNAERLAARVDAIAALWGAPREVVQATLLQYPTLLTWRLESLMQKAALIRGILAGSGIPSWQAASSGPWTLYKLHMWLLNSEGRILRLRYLLDAGLAHEFRSPFEAAKMPHARWNSRFPGFAAWQTQRAAGDGGAAALVDAPLTRRQP
ncbi:MAG: hypothetical protein J3K34DRAFT_425511 [Monoraphidium minutum]|nr:MAG: hypothetical protein J3K34DRAFT_425511 [Monoraphidium minutum]